MGDVAVDVGEGVGFFWVCFYMFGMLLHFWCIVACSLYLLLCLVLFLRYMPSITIFSYLPHRGITLTWWCGLIPFGVTNDPCFF